MITRKSTANVPIAWNIAARSAEGIVGIRKMERLTIGSPTVRSMNANTTSRAAPATSAAASPPSKEAVESLTIAHRIRKRPVPSAAMPGQSIRWRSRGLRSWSNGIATARATTPVGTLIQKIQRHDT